MKEEADNEKLLIRYLLGDLPEEQKLQVEGMYLRDDQHYERLLAIEDELFYDYAQGKLSPGERKQFEERFLASRRNSKRAMLASALIRKMSEVGPAETAEPGLAVRERRFRWQSLKPHLRVQSGAVRFSMAALAIMLFASIWLIIRTVRLQNEFNRFREERKVQEDRLQQQTQQERARADELSLRLKREVDEFAMLKAQSGQRLQKLPYMISLELEPSFVRGQAAYMKKLQIPPGIRQIKLQLNLKSAVEYKSYQVIMLTVDGAEKWSQGMVRAQRRGSDQEISLKLPSRLLAEGDYELRVKGYTVNGTLEETGDYYYFGILRK
jgi:hypothetical protein